MFPVRDVGRRWRDAAALSENRGNGLRAKEGVSLCTRTVRPVSRMPTTVGPGFNSSAQSKRYSSTMLVHSQSAIGRLNRREFERQKMLRWGRPTQVRKRLDALADTADASSKHWNSPSQTRSNHADGSRPPNMIANTTTVWPSSR